MTDTTADMASADETMFKAELVAEWPDLARSLDDTDIQLLWSNKYRTIGAIKGAERHELKDIGLHMAILGILKPAEGTLTSNG